MVEEAVRSRRASEGSASVLPSGTVTFLFTDIEGSTKRVHELGTERWQRVLTDHARLIRTPFAAQHGHEVRTEGDRFFYVFGTARQAVAAAAEAQRALSTHAWPFGTVKVRMGMHSGEAVPAGSEAGADYVGYAVHHAARVGNAGHGGQVLLTSTTKDLLEGGRLPEGVSLRDLGQHRLKDMSEPDRLYQLVIDGVDRDFLPLLTLDRAPHNLPVQATSFVGREYELAQARELLERTRLLALTGPGGTGKTRLSLQLAAEMVEQFPDGVWFVRLAPVRDPDLVASSIAQTLGVQVTGSATPMDRLIEHLRKKRVLLVLDNFEQVIEAAADVSRLLAEAPQLKVIVTTRAVLHVYGEQEFPVPPLELPDLEHLPELSKLSMYEAVRLFIERARAARPEFAVTNENAPAVAGICARLDGLPLAIELAAAKVRILPPQAIYSRLGKSLDLLQSGARDLPPRQRTLRGAIAWSHDLLEPAPRLLFQRLAVFLGGASLSEIERVCGPAEQLGGDVLEALTALVDQSLLRQQELAGEPRFPMLEVIREFAREKLDESGEASRIDERHMDAFVDLAERARPQLRAERQKQWLDRLEVEHGNLRAAFDRAVAAGHAERALRLVAALWRFWQFRGHLREGRQRAEQALALPGAKEHARAYLGAVDAAGGLTYWLGEVEPTRRYYTEQLDLARQLGDRVALANALYNYGFTFMVTEAQQDLVSARKLLDEALSVAREAGDTKVLADVLWGIAGVLTQAREFVAAQRYYDEATDLYRRTGDHFGLAWASRSAGLNLLKQGLTAQARERIGEGIQLVVAAGDQSGLGILLNDMAEVARGEGDPVQAQRLRGASAMITAQTGAGLVKIADLIEKRVADFGGEGERAAFEEGTQMTIGEAVAYALGRHGRTGTAAPALEMTAPSLSENAPD